MEKVNFSRRTTYFSIKTKWLEITSKLMVCAKFAEVTVKKIVKKIVLYRNLRLYPNFQSLSYLHHLLLVVLHRLRSIFFLSSSKKQSDCKQSRFRSSENHWRVSNLKRTNIVSFSLLTIRTSIGLLVAFLCAVNLSRRLCNLFDKCDE